MINMESACRLTYPWLLESNINFDQTVFESILLIIFTLQSSTLDSLWTKRDYPHHSHIKPLSDDPVEDDFWKHNEQFPLWPQCLQLYSILVPAFVKKFYMFYLMYSKASAAGEVLFWEYQISLLWCFAFFTMFCYFFYSFTLLLFPTVLNSFFWSYRKYSLLNALTCDVCNQ